MRGDLLGRMGKQQARCITARRSIPEGRDRNLRSRFAPLQAPFPLAAGALAKQWCIKELRGSESRYSVLGEQASWKQAFNGLDPKTKPASLSRCWLLDNECFAERSGFEPEIPFWGIHAFQACLLSHSSISPWLWDCKCKKFLAKSNISSVKMIFRSDKRKSVANLSTCNGPYICLWNQYLCSVFENYSNTVPKSLFPLLKNNLPLAQKGLSLQTAVDNSFPSAWTVR